MSQELRNLRGWKVELRKEEEAPDVVIVRAATELGMLHGLIKPEDCGGLKVGTYTDLFTVRVWEIPDGPPLIEGVLAHDATSVKLIPSLETTISLADDMARIAARVSVHARNEAHDLEALEETTRRYQRAASFNSKARSRRQMKRKYNSRFWLWLGLKLTFLGARCVGHYYGLTRSARRAQGSEATEERPSAPREVSIEAYGMSADKARALREAYFRVMRKVPRPRDLQ